jgi:AraC-like DNA-binding protein
MPPNNFCTSLKNYNCLTLVEYLIKMRIGYGCNLLGDGDKNISEVAYVVGFKNRSNFNRHFKRNKNITPLKYRQSLSRKFQNESK